jgi:hypothetical protein
MHAAYGPDSFRFAPPSPLDNLNTTIQLPHGQSAEQYGESLLSDPKYPIKHDLELAKAKSSATGTKIQGF